MITEAKRLLNVGLYSPAEAAHYARMTQQKFARWVFGAGDKSPVFEPQLGRERGIATFLDFAQSLTIHDIRLSAQVPLQKIRKAYQFAQDAYKIAFPFAVEHGIFIFGNLEIPKSCDIGIYIPRRGETAIESELSKLEFANKLAVQLTGKHAGNILISVIIQSFSKNLLYDNKTGLASEYLCYEGHGHRILMDPAVRCGKPYLEKIGYEAETLADAVRVEKSTSRVARLYDVDESAVLAALDYHRLLSTDPPKQSPKPFPPA